MERTECVVGEWCGQKDIPTASQVCTTMQSVGCKLEPMQTDIQDGKDARPPVVEAVRVAAGNNFGDRLFLETEKLKLLINCLEALCEAAPANEPRTVSFTPNGIFTTVAVRNRNEHRYHSLTLAPFFFARYHCIAGGFRAIWDMGQVIGLLKGIYGGKCVKIMDNPDGTMLVHARLDDHKSFDGTITPLDPKTVRVPPPTTHGDQVSPGAYSRYPFLIKMSTDWLHNIFKRLQKHSEVIVEFDGPSRTLSFIIMVDGAPRCHRVTIDSDHILQNPFATPPAEGDTHIVYSETKKVTEAARDRVPQPAKPLPPSELLTFQYRARFVPRVLWLAVKRNKIGHYLYLQFAEKQPLLLQYVLQRSISDSTKVASYDIWISPMDKVSTAAAQITVPHGGPAMVTSKMMELAPHMGTPEHTAKVAAVAVKQVTGQTIVSLAETRTSKPPVVPESGGATRRKNKKKTSGAGAGAGVGAKRKSKKKKSGSTSSSDSDGSDDSDNDSLSGGSATDSEDSPKPPK
jgi:hypothetical protein